MTKTKIAVVGCGHLGTIHARLLAAREDVDLVAVVDASPEAAQRVAAAHGCEACAGAEELVGRVEAAVVATPTGLHAGVSLPLLAAGIDLLVEKPIASTVEDARAIVTTARRHGRVVAVGHVERFNPAWRLAVERVGRPLSIEAARLAPFTFRSMDVGVVHDLMIHDIDLVLSLDPGRLQQVEAHGLAATGGHEDAVKARLVFSSGLVADLTASRISPVLRRTISIWSANALAAVDFNAKSVEVIGASPAVEAGRFVAAAVPPADRPALKETFFRDVLPLETLAVPEANAIACEHDDFLAAMRTGRAPLVSASAGAAALEIANQVIDCLACTRFGAVQEPPATITHPAASPRPLPPLPRRKTG
ncbi:MAG: gfo/Idh/MocA family oxidoreductase [Planctomycetia bacterium]|nr:gfo/Idh/MocA family oxidoreductase [Planctomycetia bacterium]